MAADVGARPRVRAGLTAGMPVPPPDAGAPINRLLAVMAALRDPAHGCAWDLEQTFATIAPYTIEEAYEVADAIDRGDLAHLKDELGDLLFQVVFHAQMASEQGAFDFEAVVGAICDKLIRRHPHVFGESGPLTAEEQSAAWEDIKARERGGGSALDGVPAALPALMRAYKLSKRAARVGFDFEHSAQTADKVEEELAEVREAARAQDPSGKHAEAPSREIFEEMGDLLFAAANLARKLGVDAESALKSANAKFERRFRAMEGLATERGQDFPGLSLSAQESLWLDVKRAE
jgi:nucleoside triphosphate diphosphatase